MAHETYIRHTDGKKAVLFIHGFLGSTEHFERFVELVPKEYGIYNILLYGHGGSVRDFSKASMSIWKGQIKDAVNELKKRYSEIIIVGHSMGTLFAVEAANENPGFVKKLFLLAMPLKIFVKPTACINTMKALFGLVKEDDEIGKMYMNAHSIKLTLKLWEYIGWIPRYLELFREARKGRQAIKELSVPSCIFQSKKDELVSVRATRYIPENENVKLTILEESAHFVYSKADFKQLEHEFMNWVEQSASLQSVQEQS